MSIYTLDRPDFAPIVLNYPSRAIYMGQSIAIVIDSGSEIVSSGSETDLVSVDGVGRFINACIGLIPEASINDTYSIMIRLYVDGTRRFNMTLNEIEGYIGGNLRHKVESASSTDYYYPDWINPVITPLMAKYDATNNIITQYELFLNFTIEFIESFRLSVYNPLTKDIIVSSRVFIGYYP